MRTNPDYLTIKNYLAGKLDAGLAHDLEKRALDDPFLADAIEGYRASQASADHELSILQRQLEQRIAIQQDNKNRFNFTTQRISIAAAAGMLFITAGLLFWMKTPRPSNQNAEAKKVEVVLSPQAASPALAPSHDITATDAGASVPRDKAVSESPAVKTARTKIKDVSDAKAADEPQANTMAIARARTATTAAFAKTNAPAIITGAITTFRGNPLPDVAVAVKGRPGTAFTDENGRFRIALDGQQTIVLAAMGYQTVEVSAKPADKLLLTMNEDANSAVVSLPGIQPKGGRAEFDRYVQQTLRYPADAEKASGEVLLSFSVSSRGKPENIRILSGLGAPYDTEAIRVLKDGPQWELNGLNVSSETTVSIKFKP